LKKGKYMNKGELIASVANKAGLKNTEATKAVEAVLETLTETLSKGDDVRLVGFGTFSVAKREARDGRNPRTGETLKIPATKIAKFKPGKELKDALK
jgi:DNA-binding protein HU-beta